MMARTFKKVESPAVAEEEPTLVLLKLLSEEADLMEEKQNLVSLKEKLLLKVQEQIKNKKNSIQRLKDEITDLKVTCEELTKSLNPGAVGK